MNSGKKNVFSTVDALFTKKPLSRTTITCSILETLLLQCRNFRFFNQILCQAVCSGLIKDTYAASRILKFSSDSPFIPIDYSHRIFIRIENTNGFIWNTMLRALVQRKTVPDSVFLYKSMIKKCSECIDNYTYPILIMGCALDLLEFEGREFHDHLVKMGFENDVYVVNNLIHMYCECGNTTDARKVFDKSPVLDSISWNSMLAGYVSLGKVEEAKLLYANMPTKNVIASNSMMVMLGKSGRVNEAQCFFNELEEKDFISWTALVSCYEQNGMHEKALEIFSDMCCNGISLDEVAIVTVLSACVNLLSIQMGKSVHCLVLRNGFESYINPQNALINMYSRCDDVLAAQKIFNGCEVLDLISWNSMVFGYIKCGYIQKARDLFDSMPEKDVVSWSSMISGYTQLDRFSETLELFHDMQSEGVKPDESTLVSVISACTHLSAIDQGKWLDAYIRKNGMTVNIILGTTLIDMYMKFGSIESAVEIFNGMNEKGVSTWNALILGYAMNGQSNMSLAMFEEMKRFGAVPNEITFVAVLGACRHMGLVEKGRLYFQSMIEVYKIEPNIKHFGCLVDLLGRVGLLKEAEEVIESMPMAPDVSTWGALLGACQKHGDKEMGERIGRKVIELQPEHDGFHVLLCSIYASKGNWGDVQEIRGLMMKQGVVKTPGCSMIETNGAIHEFLVGDKSHRRIEEIEKLLKEMVQRMKMSEYLLGDIET